MPGNHARLQSTAITVTAREAPLESEGDGLRAETNAEDSEGHDMQAEIHQPLSPHSAKAQTPVRKREAATVF